MNSTTKKSIFITIIAVFSFLVMVQYYRDNQESYDINPFSLNQNFGIEERPPEDIHNHLMEKFTDECSMSQGITVGDHIRKSKCMYKKKCIADAISRCDEQSSNMAKEQIYSMCISPNNESNTLQLSNLNSNSNSYGNLNQGNPYQNTNTNIQDNINMVGKPGKPPRICKPKHNQTPDPLQFVEPETQIHQNQHPQIQQNQQKPPSQNYPNQNHPTQNQQSGSPVPTNLPTYSNDHGAQPLSGNFPEIQPQPIETSFPKDDSWYYLNAGKGTPIRCASNGEIECASDDGVNCLWGKYGNNYQAYQRMKDVQASQSVSIPCPGWKPKDGSNPCQSLKCV